MLFHNIKNYNFWAIYDCIKSFYTIGIANPDQDVFEYFPGTRALVDITADNIFDENNFKDRWLNFISKIEQHTQKKVLDTTYAQAPSFSCVIELECNQQADVKRIKELHLSVSLIGPFYCIIGRDRNEITLENAFIQSDNYLVVSPEQSFSEVFFLLCQLVEAQFANFKFVPFYVNKMEIKGIQIPYMIEKREAVFHALFNEQVTMIDNVVGNEYFQFERWKIENLNKNEGGNNTWTIGPPGVSFAGK